MPLAIHVLRKFEPAAWGGIETHLLGLLPELARLGWAAEVHAPAEAGTDGAPLARIGVALRTFRARYPYVGMTASSREGLVASGGNLVCAGELARLATDRRASLLHAHTLRRVGGVVRTAARVRGCPYAVTLHGPVRADGEVVARDVATRTRGMVDLGAPFGWFVGARRVVEESDLVFALNRRERDAWQREREGRHLALVSLGIATTRASDEARASIRARVPGLGAAPFVAVVARLERAKGQDVGVRAFLRAAPPGTHLVLAGASMDATFARELHALAATDPRVHVLGSVAPEVARALIAEAVLVLIPSRAEPFGLALLEAWAEGTPALFAGVGGLVDIAARAGGESGRVDEPTEERLGDRLGRALGDTTWRAREAELGPERVARHFTWRALAREIAASYDAAVASRRRRRGWASALQRGLP